MKSINWKVFFILLAASVFGVITVLPYTLTLQADVLAKATLPMPLPLLLVIQVTTNAVMFAIAIFIGLLLAKRIGLGLPILEAKLAGEHVTARVKAILLPSILPGIAASILIIALDKYLFGPGLVAQLGDAANALNLQTSQPPAWQGLLASFYGGINEEILLRLFILTLLAWLGKFINSTPEGKPTLAVFWTVNALTAILFGLGHLPVTSTIISLTPLVVVRAIVLNGLAGLVFGYLYWTRGLESAMLSHFSADLVLHVLIAM